MKGTVWLQPAEKTIPVPVKFNYYPETDVVELIPNKQFTKTDIAGVSYDKDGLRDAVMVSIRRCADEAEFCSQF